MDLFEAMTASIREDITRHVEQSQQQAWQEKLASSMREIYKPSSLKRKRYKISQMSS